MAANIVGKVLKIVVGLVMLAVVVVAGFAIYFFLEIGARPSTSSNPVSFSIKAGETLTQVTDDLVNERIINNAFVFRLRAKMLGAESKIEAGDFTLSRNMTVDEVLEKLSHARLLATTITIPEGERAEQIAQMLDAKGIVKQADFMNLVEHGDFSQQFSFLKDKPADVSLEGFLFPDTYSVPVNYSAHDIIVMMLKNFQSKMSSQLLQQIDAQGGMWKVLTVASIVEREAEVDSERPTIASVYYNRITKVMKLQADPTSQYARDTLKYQQDPTFSDWWKAPTTEDLKIESPYNTYVAISMPPGPICDPGLASIQAAANPDQTDYLYFVAKGDGTGTHAFAKTEQEQETNIQKYQSGN